jgi:hypothetical protein
VGRDAFGLADALRLGAIERSVYKERGHFGGLGYRARGFRWIRDGVLRGRGCGAGSIDTPHSERRIDPRR